MKNPIKQIGITLAALIVAACVGAQAQQANTYFTGDGGKGIRLAVLEPAGKGLSEDDKWMLSLVQGSISGDFNKYSGMTIIDRQNLEKILGEWEESMSGNYSDEDRAKIGNLTNTNHILTGSISKTANSFIIEFYVTDVQSGERKASYSPKPVSLLALENLSAVKEASADLLTQLGVNLTGAALAQLKQVENTAKIQAETMLARGISAQKKGTEVAALSYYFQAAILDPSLAEAVNRSSVMAANISSGNIGEDARNDIAWRKAWIARLEEAEKYFDNINRTVSMPYTLFYSDEIIKGNIIDYKDETMSLSIKTNLYGGNNIRIWALSVERALQAVYDGLEATKRQSDWGLDRWPYQCVTNLKPFTSHSKNFDMVVELVNDSNKVIGREVFRVSGSWGYMVGGYVNFRHVAYRPSVTISTSGRKDVKFTKVKVDDITESLTIRFASVNGEAAETAAKKGVLQIKAMTKGEFDTNNRFAFKFGIFSGYKVKESDGNINIPNTIWDDDVTIIARYDNEQGLNLLTNVTIPNSVTWIGSMAFSERCGWNFADMNKLTSVTIPNSVTYIGERAFCYNKLTSVVIPNSLTYIRDGTFEGNQLTSIIIPNSVTSIGKEAFANNRLTNVVISNSVTSIGEEAFKGNSLTSITIPNSVTSIGAGTFADNQLTSVIIPNSVTSIGNGAFAGNQLTSVIIPNSVTSIGNRAFNGNQLTSVTIGAGVEIDWDIDGDTFYGSSQFNYFYTNNGKKAGTYTRLISNHFAQEGRSWSYSPPVATVPNNVITENMKEERRNTSDMSDGITVQSTPETTANAAAQVVYEMSDGEVVYEATRASDDVTGQSTPEAETYVERPAIGWDFSIGGGFSLMNEVDSWYSSGGQFHFGVGWLMNRFNFVHAGLDLNWGAIGFNNDTTTWNEIKAEHPNINDEININKMPFFHSNFSSGFFNLGAFVKLYPADIMYLSGGVGFNWRYSDALKQRISLISVVEPVYSVGAGFSFAHAGHEKNEGVVGIILEAQYNMVPLKDRLAGYLSINLLIGVCRGGI